MKTILLSASGMSPATITLPKEIAANYLTQGLSSFKKKLEDKGMKNKTRFFLPDRGRLGFEIDFS